ncbi:alanine/glycine:cation symporter family protein [Limnoraphis robusta]|uniref:Alanine/glycine:cation symporter family protein n=1 Tax=Limnoraphis robusta CCNP1315 TaxID=3110306 RepID=A0ABU5UAA3_9CYAN|nr:alanine/glycine:cation symporter family protein [Limnoraphis robusta]MEA5523048.1 alanine/glycine:cation symporter family protein [Limnoraphis robusta CCNP1315]MEA5548725.1 alanine/glycine:cation symporter family protein [Limnoraphis robusta CCNP1324]
MLAFLNDLIWGKILIFVLIAVGLLLTISSRFVQFRYFGRMFTILGESFHREEGHLSSFQALALSVAGRVGAGNIAGVAVAITLGGAGAIFWMWVIGLIGMATSFFECTLAQLFKNAEPDGTYRGGPAYYIERGLGKRWLASLFSALLLITFGLGFNALQSYTVATSIQDTFGVPTSITGVILLIVLGLIIFGGIKRIADVAEFVVPIMAIGYLAMSLFVLVTNIAEIPNVFSLIFKSAFGLQQAVSGGVGAAILFGVKRGLFSNEAGLGSAPNVAAVAYVEHPVNQGIIQSFSVFIDTIILCTCTAAIILLSSVYQPDSDVSGIVLTQAAMAEHVGGWGRAFVTIALVLFAFTSMIYNYYLGENSLNFFSPENKLLFNIFRGLTLALVVWGSAQDLSTVFAFADLTMGLLALVNLVAVFLLFKVGLRVMKDFDRQVQAGDQQPIFDASRFSDLNIDRQAWREKGDNMPELITTKV